MNMLARGMKKHTIRPGSWFLTYTFWYLLFACGVYIIFTLNGRTLIWSTDGIRQVYTTMSYISEHIRTFIATGRLTFDMMDFSLGQGMDVLSSMCFYGLTDPINLLSALTTGDGMEFMYAVAIGVRVYFAGAAFGLYLRYAFKSEGWATAAAATIYVASGYLLFTAVRHPHFVNGALYLPLILFGVEKLLGESKPHAFIGFTALMLFVNFFFAYTNTILAILYIVLRLAFRFRERRLRGTAADGFALLGSYLLGMAISAVVFLPITFLYLQNGRTAVQQGYAGSLLMYPLKYYALLFTSAVQPSGSSGYWSVVGLSPIALFCAVLLLFKRGKNRTDAQILVYATSLFLLLLFPFVGKIFNAFGYVTNRWSYALAFPVSASSAIMLPELARLDKKRLTMLGVFCTLYLLAAVFVSTRIGLLKLHSPGFAAIVACLMVLVLLRTFNIKSKFVFQALISLLAFSYASFVYSPLFGDYVSEFNKRGVFDRIMNSDLIALHLIDDDGVYRSTQTNINDPFAHLIGYKPALSYWSILPAWTADYQKGVMLSSRTSFHNAYGLDGRTTLNALAGLKNIVRTKGDLSLLPYGSYPVAETENALVYQNPYALPFGYAFPEAVAESALEALSPIDRELIHAQFAVVEDTLKADLPVGQYKSPLIDLDWTLQAISGVELHDHRINSENGGTMRMAFDAPAGHNVYILIDGVTIKKTVGTKPIMISFATVDVSGRGFITDNRDNFSYEQEGLLLDLGCINEPRDGADLLISKAAQIGYEDIRVYAVPIETITMPLERLAAQPLENIKTCANQISGEIALDQPAILQVCVQYGDGWSATVDSKEVEVFRSGGMYTGVRLDAGAHRVVLRYRTPYIREGTVVSGIGLLVWASLAVLMRLTAKRQTGKKRER